MSVDLTTERVLSFGRCAAGTSLVARPTSVEEVFEVFALARSTGKRVTIRGGGHSFDGQAVHDGDDGSQIILNTDKFQHARIEFDDAASTVTLGAGVPWGTFFRASIDHARQTGGPIRLPGSVQTGRKATAAGTLAGDCLSRFSGTVGKESQWIQSFRLATPAGEQFDVSVASNPQLFNAVVGGHGYIGFVTDVTYKLVSIDAASRALTEITTHRSFGDLIARQMHLVNAAAPGVPTAVSSAWFTPLPFDVKGAVFKSTYAKPGEPRLPGFPLYDDIDCESRYWTELMARIDPLNIAIHEILFHVATEQGGRFENDLEEFLFFMDGNTVAKEKFEALHRDQLFPIVQQTFVVPPDQTERFANKCVEKMLKRGIQATECDMLFARQDDCLMSGNYHLDGFAVSLGFEPIKPKGCPPDRIPKLLRELSEDCQSMGGRLHLVKNVQVDRDVFREMFSPQILEFEAIKKKYDPDRLLQNRFSDDFFDFS